MQKNFGLQMPIMPNFITVLIPGSGVKADGFKQPPCIDVADLTESEAMEYAENMRKHFLAHYTERSRNKGGKI